MYKGHWGLRSQNRARSWNFNAREGGCDLVGSESWCRLGHCPVLTLLGKVRPGL